MRVFKGVRWWAGKLIKLIYLQHNPSSIEICCIEEVRLGLKLARDHQEVMGHHIEFVQEQ